ncbi:MAG: hypothetical protein LBB88_10135 [Planctomycetaceae bacterium]|nr:hypothetical protein [Planctomycetaceae bacterium]
MTIKISFNNLISLLLTILISLALINSVNAQPIRKLIRRIIEPETSEPYRVSQQENNRVNRNTNDAKDKRLIERAVKTINLIAGNGQELKPVIAVSLASFDDYKKTMHTVTEQIRKEHGNNKQPETLDNFLNLYEKFISKHFDSKQPFGLILQTDGILYYPLIFMPLNANSDFIKQLENDYVEKLDNGLYAVKTDIIKWSLGRLYVKEHNGWIFIATEFQLNSLPDDPSKLLIRPADIDTLMTARFDLKNVPKLTTRAALSLAEIDAVSKAETIIEKATARLSIGHIRSLAEQAEFLEYVFAYDQKKNNYIIREIEIVRPNTEQAKLLHQRRNVTSPFHAFYMPENAILASHLAFNMTQLQRSQYEIILDEAIGQYLLTAEERKELQSSSQKHNRNENKSGQSDKSENSTQSNETSNSRDRLAALLTLNQNKNNRENNTSAENRAVENNNVNNNGKDNNNGNGFLPEFPLAKGDYFADGNADKSKENLSDTRKLEIMLRRIAVCYYWGLLGSIRSGQFDIATTWSDENGVAGAFKITEGKRFKKSFDQMFSDMSKEFPNVYSSNVRKDYRQFHGFNFTSVSVKLSDLLKGSPIGFFVTENRVDVETEKVEGKKSENGINILLAVRGDAVCYSICRAADRVKQERQFEIAIEGIEKSLPVYDIFFTFSAYELGKLYAKSGNSNRFSQLRSIASSVSPNAMIQAQTEFTDNSKTTTIRASALLTPSLWRLKENRSNNSVNRQR